MKYIIDSKYHLDQLANSMQLPLLNFNIWGLYMIPTFLYAFGYFTWTTLNLFTGFVAAYFVFNLMNTARLKRLSDQETHRISRFE